MKERANRVLQRQQNRLLQQNRILPYQGSGYGSNGGFLREYGGTGVFHPRINNYTTSVSTASVAKKQSELFFLFLISGRLAIFLF